MFNKWAIQYSLSPCLNTRSMRVSPSGLFWLPGRELTSQISQMALNELTKWKRKASFFSLFNYSRNCESFNRALLFCNICLWVPIHATESVGTGKSCKNDASKILKRKLPMFLEQRKGLILPETTILNELHKSFVWDSK